MNENSNVCSIQEILRFEDKDWELAKELGFGEVLTPLTFEKALKTPEIQSKLEEIQELCQRVGVRVKLENKELLEFLKKILVRSTGRKARASFTEFEPSTLDSETIMREFFSSSALSVEEKWKVRRRRDLSPQENNQSFSEKSGIYAFGGREFMWDQITAIQKVISKIETVIDNVDYSLKVASAVFGVLALVFGFVPVARLIFGAVSMSIAGYFGFVSSTSVAVNVALGITAIGNNANKPKELKRIVRDLEWIYHAPVPQTKEKRQENQEKFFQLLTEARKELWKYYLSF